MRHLNFQHTTFSITAPYLNDEINGLLGVIDDIVPEPPGGAHSDANAAYAEVRMALTEALQEVSELSVEDRLARRYERFRRLGVVVEN